MPTTTPTTTPATPPVPTRSLVVALAAALADSAGVTGPHDASPIVFAGAAQPADPDGRYASVNAYGGNSPRIPLQTVSLQVAVEAHDDADAFDLADALHDGCLETDGRPRRDWLLVDGDVQLRVAGVHNLRRPALAGRGDGGRPRVVFNFDVAVHRTTTA